MSFETNQDIENLLISLFTCLSYDVRKELHKISEKSENKAMITEILGERYQRLYSEQPYTREEIISLRTDFPDMMTRLALSESRIVQNLKEFKSLLKRRLKLYVKYFDENELLRQGIFNYIYVKSFEFEKYYKDSEKWYIFLGQIEEIQKNKRLTHGYSTDLFYLL